MVLGALAAALLLFPPGAAALNNGLALKPPMGYNTYMGHTDIMTIAKFFVSSGFKNSGYEFVNSDEGWEEKARDNSTGKIVPSPAFGGSTAGIKKLVSEIHGMGLKIGLYGAASGVTWCEYGHTHARAHTRTHTLSLSHTHTNTHTDTVATCRGSFTTRTSMRRRTRNGASTT